MFKGAFGRASKELNVTYEKEGLRKEKEKKRRRERKGEGEGGDGR